MHGTKVIIIDPQGEYRDLVAKFSGQRIDLSRSSNTIINPLDLMGHTYPEKRLALMDLMPVMLGELSEPQKAFMDRALTQAYEQKGIYMNNPNSWKKEPPILEDLLNILEKYEKRATMLEKSSIRSLMNRLNIYVKGVFYFLNKQTNINFNNRLVCFDIGNLPKQVRPTMMFLVLDYVYAKMKKDLTRKLLIVDEAWSLLSRTADAAYIFEIVKTCRKYNLGLFLINQEVEDMLNSKAGRSVLANSSYTLLLKQKAAVIDDIQKTFHLSNSERIHLLTAMIGEGILIMEDDHSKLKIIASEKEHDLITTNADELLLRKSEYKGEKEKSVKTKSNPIRMILDEEQGLYRFDGLSKNDVEYLMSKSYIQYETKSTISNKLEKFLIRPRFNESLPHAFMVFELAHFIRKQECKVWLHQTRDADIVFEANGKKYAIEVETGTSINHYHTKLLDEKIKYLKKTYGNNWFFVLTNKKLGPAFSRLGPTTDKRYILNKIKGIIKDNKKSHHET